MVTEASRRESARAHAPEAFAILPQLTQADVMPEVNSLAIGQDGRLTLRGRPREVTVAFRYAGRSVTARFTRDGDRPILLEVGCRLARLPYTIEGRESRRRAAREGTMALWTTGPAMADPAEATAGAAGATRRPQGDLLRGRVDGRPS